MASDEEKQVMVKVAAVEQASDYFHSDDTIREERNITLSKYAGWEQFLIPAPMTIAFLGQLMLISTFRDFALNNKAPKGGFKFLRNPMSFRASVLQVSNSGWKAFHTANRSMDQIRMYLNTVPLHVQSVFNILESASNEEVQHVLPPTMMAIKNVADKCLQVAKKTEDGFIQVMDIIAELQEACVSTKGHYESQRQYAKSSLEAAKEEKRVIEEEKEQLKKQQEKLLQTIQEAEKQFSESVTSLPSVGKVFGMAIVEGIVDGATVVLDGVSKPLNMLKKAKTVVGDLKRKSKNTCEKTNKTPEDKDIDQVLDEPSRKSHQQVPSLYKIVNNLVNTFVHGDSLNKSEVQNSDKMMHFEGQVGFVIKHLEGVETCQIRTEILQLSARIKSICTRLDEIKRNISGIDPAEAEELAKAMIKLQDDTIELFSTSQSAMNSCPRQRPPNMKTLQSRYGNDEGAVRSTINKARVKAEGSLELLKKAQDDYAKSSEKVAHASERMSTVLAEMAKLDMEKLTFEEIIDILHRGLSALGDMRKQWGKIVHFFQTITNIIDCSLDVSLHKFLDISQKAKSCAVEGYTLSHLKRDMLHREAIHISELVGFVTLVAESYLEVSACHVMPKLDGLHKLLCYDPQKDKHVIQQRQLALQDECTDAQREIADMIERKRREYHHVMERRIAALQHEMSRVISVQEPSGKPAITSEAMATEANTSEVSCDDFI